VDAATLCGTTNTRNTDEAIDALIAVLLTPLSTSKLAASATVARVLCRKYERALPWKLGSMNVFFGMWDTWLREVGG
jgi:hypothetical protein